VENPPPPQRASPHDFVDCTQSAIVRTISTPNPHPLLSVCCHCQIQSQLSCPECLIAFRPVTRTHTWSLLREQMTDPTADDSHCERCHTVGELRDALADLSDDRPLTIDHRSAEFENVIVRDDDDQVVLY